MHENLVSKEGPLSGIKSGGVKCTSRPKEIQEGKKGGRKYKSVKGCISFALIPPLSFPWWALLLILDLEEVSVTLLWRGGIPPRSLCYYFSSHLHMRFPPPLEAVTKRIIFLVNLLPLAPTKSYVFLLT